jgi:hypothetical protein
MDRTLLHLQDSNVVLLPLKVAADSDCTKILTNCIHNPWRRVNCCFRICRVLLVHIFNWQWRNFK